MLVIGIDIGGTKCATLIAEVFDDRIEFKDRMEFLTKTTPDETIAKLLNNIKIQLTKLDLSTADIKKIGIACGGPLNVEKGLIMSPPNLPGWDNIAICDIFEKALNIKCFLMNDADAGAIAEWRYGAAKGYNNVVFITFGTGLGAGLILNGQLYRGGSGMAGEIGHLRIYEQGPIGYGKKGSFEGYCSGGGIQQQIDALIIMKQQQGIVRQWFNGRIDAKLLFQLAKQGDDIALELVHEISYYFGKGLAIIIDILNPDIIVIGGIYMRNHRLFQKHMVKALEKESIKKNLEHVKILPAKLKEKIGDYASISASLQ